MKGSKVAIIVGALDYKDDNMFRLSFQAKGAEVTVFSDSADEEKNISGLEGAELSDYDIIIFEGSDENITANKELKAKLKQLFTDGKIIAAGNGAEILLSGSGLLKGKKVSKPVNSEVEKKLISDGGSIDKKGVVVSGKLVTYSGTDILSINALSDEIGKIAKVE